MADGDPLIETDLVGLSAGIAHDLNNLLASILNLADLAGAGLSPVLDRPDADPALAAVVGDTEEIVRLARQAADLVGRWNLLVAAEGRPNLSDGDHAADGSPDAVRERYERNGGDDGRG